VASSRKLPRAGTADGLRGRSRSRSAKPVDVPRSRSRSAKPVDGPRGRSRSRSATPADGPRGRGRSGSATPAPAGDGARSRASLLVRGTGIALGGLVLGIGTGIAVERALIGRDRRREDPEAGEVFGALRGVPDTIISHDGTELEVEDFGSGPCLVFSHGFSLNQDAWHYQRRDLPAEFRCVFFDQRGHGRSGRPANHDFSLDAFAGDLRAVLDWTGEDRVVLVAHSMGGIAALKLAELWPEEMGTRIAGLVLVDSTYADALKGMSAAVTARGALTVQRAAIRTAFKFFGADPVRANQLRRRGSDLGYLGTRLFGFGSNPSPSQVAFVDRILAGTDIEVWAKVFPSLLDFDLSEVLERLDVPTIIAVGDKDRLTPVVSARHMAEKIGGARLVVLEDAGHNAFMEEHEVLDAEITAFAREVLGPARHARRRRRAARTSRLASADRLPIRRVRGS
jgi:pimeloyl-ACP methyl ester carboxylesterase